MTFANQITKRHLLVTLPSFFIHAHLSKYNQIMVLTGLNVRYTPQPMSTINGFDARASSQLPKELRSRTPAIIKPYLSPPERISKAGKFAIDFWNQKKRMDAADERKENVRILLGLREPPSDTPQTVYNVRMVNPNSGGNTPESFFTNGPHNPNGLAPSSAPRRPPPPPTADIGEINPVGNQITTVSSANIADAVERATGGQNDRMLLDPPLQQLVTNNHFYDNRQHQLVQTFTNNENQLNQMLAVQNNSQYNAFINNSMLQNNLQQNIVNNTLQQNDQRQQQLNLHQTNNNLQHVDNRQQHLNAHQHNNTINIPGLMTPPTVGRPRLQTQSRLPHLGINGRPPMLAIDGPGSSVVVQDITEEAALVPSDSRKRRRRDSTPSTNPRLLLNDAMEIDQSSSSKSALVPFRRRK